MQVAQVKATIRDNNCALHISTLYPLVIFFLENGNTLAVINAGGLLFCSVPCYASLWEIISLAPCFPFDLNLIMKAYNDVKVELEERLIMI